MTFPTPPNPVFPATYDGSDKESAYDMNPPVGPATTVVGPDAFGAAAAVGTSLDYARQDHDHGLPAPAVPAFVAPTIALGTAAAIGVSGKVINSDATIVGFDATVPVTQAFGDAAATGAAVVSARRDHKHGMPANPVVTPNTQSFLINGVWVKPAGCTLVEITAIGGGGGGGSGRKGAVARAGGSGGGGGALSTLLFAAADVPAGLDIHIGGGGTFGAAQATNSTDGIAGAFGGDTWVAATSGVIGNALIVAGGGEGGKAGTNAQTAGATGGQGLVSGQSGGLASVTVASPNASSASGGAGGGGGGGGVTVGGIALAGGTGAAGGPFAGGTSAVAVSPNIAGPTNFGGAGGAAETAGTAASASSITGQVGKGGGGGGGGLLTPGAGALGSVPGGGGGGGGAGTDAVASSAVGARGQPGAVFIQAW